MTAITRTVTVRLDPSRAFDVFTADMNAWFPRGPHSFNHPDRAVGIELEPGVGGRWREVWNDGDGYEIGRVLAWEPGRRLLLSYRNRYLPEEPLTEIEVRFEPVPGGTTVVLEHRGWELLPPEALREWAGRAWRGLMAAFARHADGTADGTANSTANSTAQQTAHRTAHGTATPDRTTGVPDRHREETTMPTSEALDRQPVTPFLYYEDGAAAMDWLAAAFGFVERTRWVADDGTLDHGEMIAGEGLVMMAGGLPAYESPRRHREHCAAAAAWSTVPWVINGVMVRVTDVDAHFERAKQAGARILAEPADKPYGRSYRAEDLEGHRWMFEGPVPS